MKTKKAIGIILIVLALGAGALALYSKQGSREVPGNAGEIAGRVVLGPTCPVERIPPDPQCAPKGYKTTVVAKRTSDGREVARTQSTSAGEFSFRLPAGSYELEALGGKFLPRCSPVTVDVVAGTTASATIYCDTGIR